MTLLIHSISTGKYGGRTFSGRYGDLKAVAYASFLHREARSCVLDLYPEHGRLKEPLMKVVQVMRALKYEGRDSRELQFYSIHDKIGQNAYQSPSVFNFYHKEYSAGVATDRNLAAPEAELATAPWVVGWLNGMCSMVEYGLTNAAAGKGGGFGTGWNWGSVKSGPLAREQANGWLMFTPSQPKNPAATVAELSLLLTDGRLIAKHGAYIQKAYASVLATAGKEAALRRALKLFMLTADFHATNVNTLFKHIRPPRPPMASHDRKFKAVVVLFLYGAFVRTRVCAYKHTSNDALVPELRSNPQAELTPLTCWCHIPNARIISI